MSRCRDGMADGTVTTAVVRFLRMNPGAVRGAARRFVIAATVPARLVKRLCVAGAARLVPSATELSAGTVSNSGSALVFWSVVIA